MAEQSTGVSRRTEIQAKSNIVTDHVSMDIVIDFLRLLLSNTGSKEVISLSFIPLQEKYSDKEIKKLMEMVLNEHEKNCWWPKGFF